MALIQAFVNIVFGVGLFVNAVLFIPQILLLVKTKQAGNISLLTFGGFCIIQIFTIWHGYFTQDYILMLGYGVSLLTCGAVTLLIIYYRVRAN